MRRIEATAVGTILLVSLIPQLISGMSVEEDLTLTAQQKRDLDMFKTRVIDMLPDTYMKHDIYLVRFLRAKNYDVNMAESLILENVKWRKDNALNTIDTEDFQDVESAGYKMFLESVDREGKPVITFNFGDWDLRKGTAVFSNGI